MPSKQRNATKRDKNKERWRCLGTVFKCTGHSGSSTTSKWNKHRSKTQCLLCLDADEPDLHKYGSFIPCPFLGWSNKFGQHYTTKHKPWGHPIKYEVYEIGGKSFSSKKIDDFSRLDKNNVAKNNSNSSSKNLDLNSMDKNRISILDENNDTFMNEKDKNLVVNDINSNNNNNTGSNNTFLSKTLDLIMNKLTNIESDNKLMKKDLKIIKNNKNGTSVGTKHQNIELLFENEKKKIQNKGFTTNNILTNTRHLLLMDRVSSKIKKLNMFRIIFRTARDRPTKNKLNFLKFGTQS